MNFNYITSWEECYNIISESQMSLEKRQILDSFSYISLVDFCEDIKKSELQEVRKLERDNVRNYFFTVLEAFNLLRGEVNQSLLAIRQYQQIIKFINDLPHEQREKAIIANYPCTMLSKNFDGNVTFLGKMPQKLFACRQANADLWFSKYVELNQHLIWHIYKTMGINHAMLHLLFSTTMFAYRLQPELYEISNKHDDISICSKILKSYFELDESRVNRILVILEKLI